MLLQTPADDFSGYRMQTEFQRALSDALGIAAHGEFERARSVLYRLAQRFADDYRVWWALANITNRPDEAHMALHEVLRLNPDQQQARELLELLDQHTAL